MHSLKIKLSGFKLDDFSFMILEMLYFIFEIISISGGERIRVVYTLCTDTQGNRFSED